MAHILLVEDDPTVTDVVVSYLQRAGNTVVTEADGGDGLRTLRAASDVDVVILDVMLPTMDGIEVCRHIRADRPRLPVIMLSALGQADDRIAGLEVGADDYIAKPFSPRELVLRVESVLRRRSGAEESGAVLHIGDLTLDTAARSALKGGTELQLTMREFDLLAHFMGHPGAALTRSELMSAVWGWTYGDQSTVTVHVRRLREKIEADPTAPLILQTVWGVGYRMGGAG